MINVTRKTLIACLSCPKYLDRRNAVRDTWAPFVEKLNENVTFKFITGTLPCLADDGVGDIVHLFSPDSYDELPQKTLKLIEYALANSYDFLVKCDDDTFIFPTPEAFEHLTAHDCVASVRQHPPHNDFVDYPQGGLYSLSRAAMESVLAQGLPKTGLEDGNVGKSLKLAGIVPVNSSRIKTDYRHGIPRDDNDIISSHSCTPQVIQDIFDVNRIRLLAAYNGILNRQTVESNDASKLSSQERASLSVHIHDVTPLQDDSVTICITSCNRHDLLRRTLQSLSKCVIDMPIKETVIIEDSDAKKPDWLLEYRTLGLGEIRWMSNGRRLGQWQSIDRMYDTVKTEYIFACEDDWEFDGRAFLKASDDILRNHPKVLQVSIRGNDNTSGHPNVDDPNYTDFKVQQPYWREHWGGFTGNPGLRRRSDWQRIRSYGAIAGYGTQSILGEQKISKAYLDAGYRIAVLPTDKPFIKHIGERRSKAIDHLPAKPKVLIAVPACHQYNYGSHANDLKVIRQTNGRMEAVRSTWWNDIKPFNDYVTAKFFYGRSPAEFKPSSDEVVLDCPDDYTSLPKKMNAIYRWAINHGFDYVFKADDDGFLHIDRLLRTDYELYDQLGFSNCEHGLGHKCNCYITGGCGYFLSKRAMIAVVNETISSWAEDLITGRALRRNNYKRVGHPGFLPGFDKHFVTLPLPDDCIAAHALTPEMMLEVYGDKFNGQNQRQSSHSW